LVGIDTSELGLVTGLDASGDLMNDEDMLISDENQFRFIDSKVKGKWAAAVSQRYTFVLSPNLLQPYLLLDSAVDPNELTNFFNQEGYKDISKKMKRALLQWTEEHDFVYKAITADAQIAAPASILFVKFAKLKLATTVHAISCLWGIRNISLVGRL